MNLKKMFDQFIPISLMSLPLTLVGGMIAISWLLFIKNTHWLINRSSIIKVTLKKMFNKLLPTKNPQQNSWSPWIFSMFLLCLSYNLLSLIPYTFSQTSHLSITFSLSLPLWLTFQMTGFLTKWKKKVSHLVPTGTPTYLIPAMVLMETLSLFIQPMTLGFRLGAKLLAGHLLIFLCSCVVWEVIKTKIMGSLSFILLFALLMLEMAVACIQAAVFLMLSKKYLEEKLN